MGTVMVAEESVRRATSEQRPPTEPVLLRDCFVDVLAELVARENVHNVINNADDDSEED